jgi:hypothetical protein
MAWSAQDVTCSRYRLRPVTAWVQAAREVKNMYPGLKGYQLSTVVYLP